MASGGEGTVTVKNINDTERVDGRDFTGLVVLDARQRPIKPGDSGSACLSRVRDDRYKMSCIVFTRAGNGFDGRAIPASVAESVLGITFGNRAPTANAGLNQTVNAGDTVTLNGSGSSDPDGHVLTYSWRQIFGSGHEAQQPGAGVTLSDATASSPTFRAPSAATTLRFNLTVTDSYGLSDTNYVIITVQSPPPPPPSPPPSPPPWTDTGSYRGCGATRQKEQRSGSSTRGVAAAESLRWGSWIDTG